MQFIRNSNIRKPTMKLFGFLAIFIATAYADDDKFVVVLGKTQVGKTTFIRSITGQSVGEVGDGDGMSRTGISDIVVAAATIDGTRYAFMDCPGFEDTQFRFSNEEVLQSVADAITVHSKKNTIDAVVLGESLSDSAMQLQQNLVALQQLFGEDILQSVVVTGLKPGFAEQVRLETINELCAAKAIPFVSYQSKGADSRGREGFGAIEFDKQGADALVAAIRRVRPYHMKKVAENRRKIEMAAQTMRATEPTKYESRYISYTQSVPYTATETYDTVESYEEEVSYWEVRKVWWFNRNTWPEYTQRLWGTRPGVPRGLPEYTKEWRTRTETKYRPVTKTRSVTRYRDEQKLKEEKVAIPKPGLLYYLQRAQKEYEAKLKARK